MKNLILKIEISMTSIRSNATYITKLSFIPKDKKYNNIFCPIVTYRRIGIADSYYEFYYDITDIYNTALDKNNMLKDIVLNLISGNSFYMVDGDKKMSDAKLIDRQYQRYATNNTIKITFPDKTILTINDSNINNNLTLCENKYIKVDGFKTDEIIKNEADFYNLINDTIDFEDIDIYMYKYLKTEFDEDNKPKDVTYYKIDISVSKIDSFGKTGDIVSFSFKDLNENFISELLNKNYSDKLSPTNLNCSIITKLLSFIISKSYMEMVNINTTDSYIRLILNKKEQTVKIYLKK